MHPRFRTPHLALLFQGFWGILLVAMGTYEQLFTYVIFAAWMFYALTGFAVIVLRRKRPGAERPYRVFGYPWVPIAFVLTSAWFIVNLGAIMVALGIPVYFAWKRRSERRAALSVSDEGRRVRD